MARGRPAGPRPTKWLRQNGSHVGAAFVRVAPEQEARERQLLLSGLTAKEVAAAVGTTPKRLRERSRLLYGIDGDDVQAGFRQRVQREGLPVRLSVIPAFGYWFAGLFDGEGHFLIRLRERQPRCRSLDLALHLYLRDDDADVLRRVHETLGGAFRPTSKKNVALWWLGGLVGLAEVVVPLFDRYPLHSKKAREFELFRRLVVERYIATLGGRRRGAPLENVEDIERAIAALTASRRYADRTSWRILEDAEAYSRLSSQAA